MVILGFLAGTPCRTGKSGAAEGTMIDSAFTSIFLFLSFQH
jgi:hypothetical protein